MKNLWEVSVKVNLKKQNRRMKIMKLVLLVGTSGRFCELNSERSGSIKVRKFLTI